MKIETKNTCGPYSSSSKTTYSWKALTMEGIVLLLFNVKTELPWWSGVKNPPCNVGNKAEADDFLELFCFLCDPVDAGSFDLWFLCLF